MVSREGQDFFAGGTIAVFKGDIRPLFRICGGFVPSWLDTKTLVTNFQNLP